MTQQAAAAATTTGTTGSTQAAAEATAGATTGTTGATTTGTQGTGTTGSGGTTQQTGATTGTAGSTTTQQPPPPPEKYELALPENTRLDQSDVAAIAALAKTKGWSQEQAAAALTEMHEHLGAQHTHFRTELEAHAEVGGTHLEQAQQHALRALDRFLPAESAEGKAFRAALNKSGYGNYAPFVVLLSRIGKAMAEDTGVITDPARSGSGEKSIVDLFYPNQAQT